MKSQGSSGYKRIVVKAGTNVLTGGGNSLDHEVIASLVEQIAEVHGSGVEVALVTSGAVAAGGHALSVNRERDDIPVPPGAGGRWAGPPYADLRASL